MKVLEGTWEEIMEHDAELSGQYVRLTVLPDARTEAQAERVADRRWTAVELMKLPPAERERILCERAPAAEAAYAEHPELMEFEAFGEEDLYD